MKDRFRKFWLATVADGFKDDLEEIRKVRLFRQLHLRLPLTPLFQAHGIEFAYFRDNEVCLGCVQTIEQEANRTTEELSHQKS